MRQYRLVLFGLGLAASAVLAGMPMAPAAAADQSDNYVVVYGSSSQVDKEQVRARGGEVQADLSEAGVLAVRSASPSALSSLPGVVGVANDHMRLQVPDEQVTSVAVDTSLAATGCASTQMACPFQWDLARMHVPQAWTQTKGSAAVKVAVLDSGLTAMHQEVGANYDQSESKSFVQPNPVCAADVATYASTADFNGHGTWTATHIAGVNGRVMTGIAPGATFVNFRVAGVCGYAADSWILAAMLYGNRIGARVENISVGGYLCGDGVVKGSALCDSAAHVGTDPILWRAYKQVVSYLLEHGTLVVAAAGNDHVQLDSGGRVVSHGAWSDRSWSLPLAQRRDLFGTTEAPGGVPGVLAVSATNRVTAQGAASDTRFGQYGAGRKDQLASYSNYGRRIDVAAPGGARNMNLPGADCLTLLCARIGPSGPGATDNPDVVGAWGTIPGTSIACAACYVTVQGTSAATPQVAGVAVLALSAHPELSPRELAALLRRSVSELGAPDATPALEDDPSKPNFRSGMDYDASGIADRLMGKGVIDAALAVAGESEDQRGD